MRINFFRPSALKLVKKIIIKFSTRSKTVHRWGMADAKMNHEKNRALYDEHVQMRLLAHSGGVCKKAFFSSASAAPFASRVDFAESVAAVCLP